MLCLEVEEYQINHMQSTQLNKLNELIAYDLFFG